MDQNQGEAKSPLTSKTVHFNLISGILVPAVWPFLPEHFRNSQYAMAAVTSWLTIGNIILRFVTHQALAWGKHGPTKDGQIST